LKIQAKFDMPLIPHSSYHAPRFFQQAHLNTIFPALFRRVRALPYQRETIPTPDGDFLDIDWIKTGSSRLIIGLHGLEGNTNSPYLQGILSYFSQHGWDALGMNFRSCSGRMNNRLRSYNMGESSDLHHVVAYAITQGYQEIVLTGFSLGGNVLLKYLGESGPLLPAVIKGAVAFSVPCHIPSANVAIAHWENKLYLVRFLQTLNAKMLAKVKQFPGSLRVPKRMPRSFQEFDSQFTAPIHGYRDAADYWDSCSSIHFLPNISIPVLLVNAEDDTFLAPPCYPRELAENHPFLYLETPQYGGHCGFYSPLADGSYWTERRALAFIQSIVS
jgi:uncharacterized protein